jgi:hypothetical protein
MWTWTASVLLLVASMGTAAAIVIQEPPHWSLKIEEWLPDGDIVLRLERAVKMPDGANDLSSYVRYYSGDRVDGKRWISGTMLSLRLAQRWDPAFEPIPTVRIVTVLPDRVGEGCEQIFVEFDVERDQVLEIFCSPKD